MSVQIPRNETMLRIADAVKRSGRCKSSLYIAIANGSLRAYKSYGRTLIAESDLITWLNSHLQPFVPRKAA